MATQKQKWKGYLKGLALFAMKLTEALIVASSLLLFVATTSGAASRNHSSRRKSFGEWTAACTYDDMEETTSCYVSSDSKASRQGLIRGQISISDSPNRARNRDGSWGLPFLDVLVSGATPSVLGPIVKVDDHPAEHGFPVGEPSYDVNASGVRYVYTLSDSVETQATVGNRLRVRVPLNTGDDLEAVFDLSGLSRAKALVDKWKATEARP